MSGFTGDPVATASQHEQELAALELMDHPTVKAAYRSVAETWLGRAKASDAMRQRFDDAFAEVMFSAAVWSSNQDKLRPKVSCITRIGHPVAGDPLYGAPAKVEGMPELGRYFLHAHRIRFHRPSGGTLEIVSPLAPELEEWMLKLS